MEETYVDKSDAEVGIQGYAVTSVLVALFTFLSTPEDFAATLCATIAAGGDTDSTAALACCLAGAHLGASRAVPPCVEALLEDQGGWRAAELRELCSRVVADQNQI